MAPVWGRAAVGATSRILAAALCLPGLAEQTLAESAPDQGQISLKYLDYLDYQPGRERARIRAPSVHLLAPLSSRWALGATAIHDAISGASPAFHTRALSKLQDERNAADLTLTRYFDDASLGLTAAYSNEADYRSRGLALSGSWSSEDRNRTWSAGLGFSKDQINPVTDLVVDEKKRVLDWTVGVTQVLNPSQVLQLTLGHNRARGYLNDPYKLSDERPRARHATRLLLRLNQHLEAGGQTLRWSLRHYQDSYGVQAQTAGLEFVQPLPWGLSLTPSLRLHNQRKARFYVEVDPEAAPFATQPPEDWLQFSLDQRLSSFGARTLGLKLAWQATPEWTADVKLEHYAQRGDWYLGQGSTGLAPFAARSWQLGLSRSF